MDVETRLAAYGLGQKTLQSRRSHTTRMATAIIQSRLVTAHPL